MTWTWEGLRDALELAVGAGILVILYHALWKGELRKVKR